MKVRHARELPMWSSRCCVSDSWWRAECMCRCKDGSSGLRMNVIVRGRNEWMSRGCRID